MKKYPFHGGKPELVVVFVDLKKPNRIWWRSLGWAVAKPKPEHKPATKDEWIKSKPISISSATPRSAGAKRAPVSSQTQSEFSPEPTVSKKASKKRHCSLSEITEIHFGYGTGKMSKVLAKAGVLPWRCWSVTTPRKGKDDRSYNFVTRSDKDAEHFVLGEISDSRPCPPSRRPSPLPMLTHLDSKTPGFTAWTR